MCIIIVNQAVALYILRLTFSSQSTCFLYLTKTPSQKFKYYENEKKMK